MTCLLNFCASLPVGCILGQMKYNCGVVFALLAALVTGSQIMAVEEPKFEIVEKIGDIEIRRMEAYWCVEIEITAAEGEAGNQAFRPLLKYISGGNKGSEKITMTAPVNQQPAGEKIAMTAPVNQQSLGAGKYVVAFVLPAEFNNRKPPEPLDERLKLRQVSARYLAAIRYRGTWSIERMEEKRGLLMAALSGQNKWVAQGLPVWSRYDPPFMPWFLRRNEVQIEVRDDAAAKKPKK